jgi:hypothetical protein
MKNIIKIKMMLLLLTLTGCSSWYVSDAQMSTVTTGNALGGSGDGAVMESAPTFSMTGGGGL